MNIKYESTEGMKIPVPEDILGYSICLYYLCNFLQCITYERGMITTMKIYKKSFQGNSWIRLFNKLDQVIIIFTNKWFLMIAGDVMPYNTITIKVVQERQTCLIISTL